MLKFIRRYKQILLVVAGVMLMIAFLAPQAISEWGNQRANVTVMKIGQRKITAQQRGELVMEFEVINQLAPGVLPLMGITEGPEQWILLSELAERSGYVGAPTPGDDILEEMGRTRGLMRLRAQYGDQLFNSLVNNPQFAPMLEGEVQNDIDAVKTAYPRIVGQARLTDQQMEAGFARLRGIQRLTRAYAGMARVSSARAVLRGERELEGAQIEYVFVPADRQLANVPEPDSAALEELLTKYKDTRPGEGEYGVGYLLPPRIKLEYLILDQEKIGANITPDLKEVRRRFNALPTKDQTFDLARAGIEQEIRKEVVERVMKLAGDLIRSRIAAQRLLDDGQFKVLPPDWETRRPRLADLATDIVAHVENQTRSEGKAGIQIDPPEVVVKDQAFLTAAELDKLEKIGTSYFERGQRRFPFSDYATAVRELVPTTAVNVQVGVPVEEPTRTFEGSQFYFTVLDTRPESAPRSVDEVREKLVMDWKKIEAYKLLVQQDVEALRQKALAEGIGSLDETRATPPEPGKPLPPPRLKSGRVTRTFLSSQDPEVNTDTFRLAVVEAAEKLDPMMSADDFPNEQRILVVPMPQTLGLAVVRIRSLVPLTVEDFRGQQNRLVNGYQLDEFRGLNANPFSVERLRQRLNVRYIGDDGEERARDAETAG